MITLRVLGAGLVLAILTACSAASPGDQRTADQVVADLAAKVSTAQTGVVFTAETDPNKLLGRPNGYNSKASFVDTRVDPALAGNQPGVVEAGGSVEVFEDEDAALARQNYITELAKQAPILGTEYSFVDGPVLLRVSKQLTPDQAAEYEAALHDQDS